MEESTLLPEPTLAGASNLSADQPWPGLASFGVGDAAYFHGREIEALELFRLIKRGTLTLLFGKSGLGKSSLLNAGLFPLLLDSGFTPLYVRFDHSEAAAPLAGQLQAAVAPLLRQAEEATLWECFHRRQETDNEETRVVPVILLDQFEEIFTLGRETVARRHRSAEFFNQLADLIQNNCPPQVQERFDRDREALRAYDFDKQEFKVLISMREEYLAFLEESRQPLRLLISQRLRLTEMSGSQALEAITMAGGHLLSEGVGESIVRFVAGADSRTDTQSAELDDVEVAPALLSLVCSELNEHRRQNGLSAISDQVLMGRRDQILRDFYERCFAGLDPGVRIFVEDQLLTTSAYRDSMAVEDAIRLKDVSAEAIEILVERRLLRIDWRGGTPRIELTHDILIDPCKRSRDLRHLHEQGWWSKVLIAASYTEKLYAVGVLSPWYILLTTFLLLMIAGQTPKGITSVLDMLVFIIPWSFWYIVLFLGIRRWTWVIRVLAQLGFLILGGILIGLAVRSSKFGDKLLGTIFVCYFLIAPGALSLLHLIVIRRTVFHRGRKRQPLKTGALITKS
jgi:hypothetical protein